MPDGFQDLSLPSVLLPHLYSNSRVPVRFLYLLVSGLVSGPNHHGSS